MKKQVASSLSGRSSGVEASAGICPPPARASTPTTYRLPTDVFRQAASLAFGLSFLILVAGFIALSSVALSDVEGATLSIGTSRTTGPDRLVMAQDTAFAPPAGDSPRGADQAQPTTTPVATVVPTATATALCNVSVEGFSLQRNEAVLRLVNHGAGPASIRAIEIAWPVNSNGPLTEVWLADHLIWRGDRGQSPTTIVPDVTGIISPIILPGDTAALTFVFASGNAAEVAQTHYTISVSFHQGCHALYSTREPIATRCKVDAGPLLVRGHKAVLTLHNSGTTDAEVRAIRVAWPAEHNGALTQIKADTTTLWRGEATSSPTTIRPTAATDRPVLRAGERALLTFTFAESAAEKPYNIMLFFVEGCHTVFSTDIKPTAAHTVRLGGVIEALPEDGLLGMWTVSGHAVLVDERTSIQPQNAQPAVGDEVKVTAIVLQNTAQVADREQLLAVHIHLTGGKGGRNVEFHGVIQQISADGQEIVVRNVTVIIDNQTQVQGQLTVGNLAYVKGKLRGNNVVLAERIVLVSVAVDVAFVQFEGPVEAFPVDWLGEWRIGGHTVIVDASTVIEGTPTIGALAEVRAQLEGEGRLRAIHIAIQEQRTTPATVRLRGVIVTLPDSASLIGNWVIRNAADANDITVSVTETTFIDQSQARAQPGAPVDANVVQQSDGLWQAIRIKVRREE